jgi:hypothetical protein
MTGDHIRALVSGEWRHAIDCGDGTVLHLAAGAPSPAVRVRRSLRPEFVSGAEKVEVVVHRERVYPARQVVARAYSRASDPALARMFETSAAFAAWCKAGHFEERESVAVSVPALVLPAGLADGSSAATPPAPRRKVAAKPAPRRAAPSAGRRAPSKGKKATPARKAAPRKAAGAGARSAKKRAAPAARRSSARRPAKASAARRKGGKARGARR